MAFILPPLPYPDTALEPHMSGQTLRFHHGNHYKKYVETLNELIAGTHFDRQPLKMIILGSLDDPEQEKIFNNAGQVWNHNFFWQCMTPHGGGQPDGELLARIESDFGSLDKFAEEFVAAAKGQFGSGWVWLIEADGKLELMSTSNADLPLAHGKTALLTCDVWEHAYYLDYQDKREHFVEVFLKNLVNWPFVQQQLAAGAAANDSEADDQQTGELAASESAVEGEGSYVASRNYRRGVEQTVKSGTVEAKAQEAKRAFEGEEGDELREAERRGRMGDTLAHHDRPEKQRQNG